jgi:hypothetical protein
LIGLIPLAGLGILLLFRIATYIPVGIFWILPIFGSITIVGILALLAVRFRRQEESLFLPAVCRQFDGLTVQVAPAGLTPSASVLQPYWDTLLSYWHLDLIARQTAQHDPKLEVRELFSAERGGVALCILAIYLTAGKGNRVERVFFGDLVKLTLPDLESGNEYAAGRFEARRLGDAAMSAGSHDLRTPQVAEALAQFCEASYAPQALGAVSGSLLYLAVPFSKEARRTGRLGLWRRVYRCESAIRLALAQLNAALHLTDAVAAACVQPAASSARAGGSVAAAVPRPPLPERVWYGTIFLWAAVIAVGIVLLALGWA